jgi:hypothetical protein
VTDRFTRGSPRDSASPTASDVPSAPRRAVVFALLAIMLAGFAVAIVLDYPLGKELWPFSAYPMYSGRPGGWTATSHRVFGVPRDETAAEIPLITDEYLYPIEYARYYVALRAIERGGARTLEPALRDTLARYEANRQNGRHHGPELRAIRLYELRTRLNPKAANRERPDGRRLLFEVKVQ